VDAVRRLKNLSAENAASEYALSPKEAICAALESIAEEKKQYYKFPHTRKKKKMYK
jgi:hypothetical protein